MLKYMHWTSITWLPLAALGGAAACAEPIDFDRVDVTVRSTSATIDETSDGLIRVDTTLDLFVPEGVELTLESATVTIDLGGAVTSHDAEIVSGGFAVEGQFDDDAFPLAIQVEASLPPIAFSERCVTGDALFVEVAVRAQGDGATEVIRSESQGVEIAGRDVILPSTFSTAGVVEHLAAPFAERPLEVLPTGDGELILNWGGNQLQLYRVDQDSLTTVATDDLARPYHATGEYAPDPQVAVIDIDRVVVGSATGPFEITITEVADDGTPVATGTIETSEWWAVDGTLQLQHLGRAPQGAYAVVQSAAPIVIDGVEYPADVEKRFSSFVVELDSTLTPIGAQRFDRALLRYEALADGTILSVSAPLEPSDEESIDTVERRTPTGATLWSTPIVPSARITEIAEATDGDLLVALGRGSNSRVGGSGELLRLSGEDGAILWSYAPMGGELSVAPLADGGALVSFRGIEPASGSEHRAVMLVELSTDGEIERAAPIACDGSATVATTSEGETLLLGSFAGELTVGGELFDVGSHFVVATVE